MTSFTSFLKDLLNYKHKAGSDGLDISSLLNNHVLNCFAKLSKAEWLPVSNGMWAYLCLTSCSDVLWVGIFGLWGFHPPRSCLIQKKEIVWRIAFQKICELVFGITVAKFPSFWASQVQAGPFPNQPCSELWPRSHFVSFVALTLLFWGLVLVCPRSASSWGIDLELEIYCSLSHDIYDDGSPSFFSFSLWLIKGKGLTTSM